MWALLFMELKEFIKSTVTQISEAVYELNDELEEHKVIVNPSGNNQISRYIITGYDDRIVTDIEFDLSLSIQENRESGAKIGVVASIVGIGLNSKDNKMNEAATRVKFSLPVILPAKNVYKQ